MRCVCWKATIALRASGVFIIECGLTVFRKAPKAFAAVAVRDAAAPCSSGFSDELQCLRRKSGIGHYV